MVYIKKNKARSIATQFFRMDTDELKIQTFIISSNSRKQFQRLIS